MKIAPVLIPLLIASVAVMLWRADRFRAVADHKPAAKSSQDEKVKSAGQSPKKKLEDPKAQRAFAERLAKMPLDELLAEFEMGGDMRFLNAAKKRFGGDPLYLMTAALASKSPDSEALAALEAAQPDNALPNILRAGIYSGKKNWQEVIKQLQIAAGKKELKLNSRERMEAKLDLFIADPSRATPETLNLKGDLNFFNQMLALGEVVARSPEVLGGTTEAAEVGIDMALRLREMGEHDFTSGIVASSIETTVLMNLDPNASFGDTGMTVGQRLDQLRNDGKVLTNYLAIRREVFNPDTSPSSRAQYFARARADGELTALNWFGEVLTAAK